MTSRKKPGVAFWATVVLSLPVLYVLSIGPAVLIVTRDWCPGWAFHAYLRIYSPVLSVYKHGPQPIHDVLDWYGHLWH